MVRSWWADVSRTSNGGKRRSKLHVAYDGWRIVKVRRLTKLRGCVEIYMDCIFPEVYDDLVELLRNCVKIYLLTRTRLIREFRDKLGLGKNDENDAIALSKIPEEAFRELSLREVEVKTKLEPLLEQYEIVSRRLKTVRQWKRESGWKSNELESFERWLGKVKKQLAQNIRRVAEKELEMYRVAESELGLKGVSLAYLLTYIDFSKGIQKIKGYARLNPKIRGVLARYAMSIYRNARRWSSDSKYAKIAKGMRRKEGIEERRN